MPGPRLDAEQEVRFAVVMYGGVSLAIYINGIVQELLRMVRATAPTIPEPLTTETDDTTPDNFAWFATSELSGTELIYRRVGQVLPDDAGATIDDKAPIRTRFVVDILSGTSAGGINAIFLAKAIANHQRIGSLRDLWIKHGDIGELLNDRASYKHLDRAPEKPPVSLLNSSRLFHEARAALDAMKDCMDGPKGGYMPSYADEVNLSVTTTDLQGLQLPIKLHDLVVYEARHRNVLRFGYAGPLATGEVRNEFTSTYDDILAFAARCTSAFPFAFSPALVNDAPLVTLQPESEEWEAFFPDYAARKVRFAEFAFADGGYLDNKPFSYATDELRRRRAEVPVKRTLLYIEPDPPGDPRAPDAAPPLNDPKEPPDALDNVLASLNLARKETIREDIEAVTERNRAVHRIRELTLDLEHTIGPDSPDPSPTAAAAYERLRLEGVIDDLTAALRRLGGARAQPDEVQAVRALVAQVIKDEFRNPSTFLEAHDVRFRLRRFAFVQDRINDSLRERPDPATRVTLKAIKKELNDAFVDLRVRARLARRADDPGSEGQLPEGKRELVPEIRELARSISCDPLEIEKILADPEHVTPGPAFRDPFLRLVRLAGEHLSPALARADAAVPAYLAEQGIADLEAYYEDFEAYDMVVLPLTYPNLEEVNPVDIVRIAPEDAINLISEGKPGEKRRKLAGTSLGHFGGFLDEEWRRNDLMWGRLDGAERILEALLPDTHERQELIDKAQATIIREELIEEDAKRLTDQLAHIVPRDDATAGALLARLATEPPEEVRPAVRAVLDKLPDQQLLEYFRACYEVPRDPDPRMAVSVASRAANITGKILDKATADREVPAKPGFWLSRVGYLAWGLVELAVPVSTRAKLAKLMFHHLASVATLLSIILIAAGVLFGVEAAQKVGWLLLGATLLLLALVWLTQTLLSPRRRRTAAMNRRWWIGGALALLLGLALVGLGWALETDFVQILGWLLAGAALVALLFAWLRSGPDRPRLRRAATGVGVGALALGIPLAAPEIPDLPDDIPGLPDGGDPKPNTCDQCGSDDATSNTTIKVDHPTVRLRGPLVSFGGIRVSIGSSTRDGKGKVSREVDRLFADQCFRFGSDELTPFGLERLERLRERIDGNRGSLRKIWIRGHTDFVGTPRDNDALSDRRARRVEKTLTEGLRLPHGMVDAEGVGESQITTTRFGDPARAYDRRVDVIIRHVRSST